jgi:hypothetical protein
MGETVTEIIAYNDGVSFTENTGKLQQQLINENASHILIL